MIQMKNTYPEYESAYCDLNCSEIMKRSLKLFATGSSC